VHTQLVILFLACSTPHKRNHVSKMASKQCSLRRVHTGESEEVRSSASIVEALFKASMI
jgi:hypothetical protein